MPKVTKTSKLARNGVQIVALGMDEAKPVKTKAEPKIPPPVQEPITNFYTDKVVELGAFSAFIEAAFKQVRVAHKAAVYVPLLASNAGWLLTPYNTACQADYKFVANHKAFFEELYNLDVVSTNPVDEMYYLRAGKPVTETTWRIWRDLLRFYAWEQMVDLSERTALIAGGTSLYRVGCDGTNEMIWQRRRLPYFKELHTKFKLNIDPRHILHLSPKDNNFIRFTPDEKSRERDLVVETTISKYLRKYHPSLTDAQLREVAELHKFTVNDEGILFYTKPEDIVRVYKHGPNSCMSKSEVTYKSPVHPAAMYGDSPGVALAALPQAGEEGKYSARNLTYTSEDGKVKLYIRNYGDSLLVRRLNKKGYVQGSWEGLKLRKIPFLDKHGKALPGTYAMPYIDDQKGGYGGAVQYAYTDNTMDYFIMGCETTCRALQKKGGGEVVLCTSAHGSIGQHVGYSAMRHNSWAARLAGDRYNEPSTTSINKWNEFRCMGCNMVYDIEHGHTAYHHGTEEKPVHRICEPCRANESMYIDIGFGGKPAFVNFTLVLLINKKTHEISKLQRPSYLNREEHHVILQHQITDYGFVRLNNVGASVGRFSMMFARIEDCVQIAPGYWVKKEDVVNDIFGQATCKELCYFFGQSSAGVLQYFPRNADIIRDGLIKGKFVILGGKIEYQDKPFRISKRKAYFAAFGELDEEEDDAPQAAFEQQVVFEQPIPILDVLNVMFAYYTVHNAETGGRSGQEVDTLFYVLQKFAPRASPDIIYMLVNTFPNVKTDRFAGLEGVPGIHHQLSVALAHGVLEDGDAETDHKTGETTLTERGLSRFAYSHCLRYFRDDSPGRYVKVKESKGKRPSKQAIAGAARAATNNSTMLDATSATQTFRVRTV